MPRRIFKNFANETFPLPSLQKSGRLFAPSGSVGFAYCSARSKTIPRDRTA
jgi:hypothetical protein